MAACLRQDGAQADPVRCASESLLRRFRKEGTLPRLHPLVEVGNAVSGAFAIPVAVFDVAKITGHLQVRYAASDEDYLTFSGQAEHPASHEVIFADQARRVHARRWTNRQSGLSAVQCPTTAALIVAEAMHDSASSAVPTHRAYRRRAGCRLGHHASGHGFEPVRDRLVLH